MKYKYRGYDARTGAARVGEILADTQKEARRVLRQEQRIIVSELLEIIDGKPTKRPWWRFWR